MKKILFRTLIIVLYFSCVSSSFSYYAPLPNMKGAVLKVITKWNSDCSGDDRELWDDMLEGWYFDITNGSMMTVYPPADNHGWDSYWPDAYHLNGDNVDSQYTDIKLVSWGNDTASGGGIDKPDVLMVGMHGTLDTNRWRGIVRVDEKGEGNCGAWQKHIYIDADLEFLHLSSCHSMSEVTWNNWNDSYGKLHQVDGFHGVMWIKKELRDNYENFSNDSFHMAIASSWMENLYEKSIYAEYKGVTDYYMQCPCVHAAGESKTDLWNRMFNERYDFVQDHPKPTEFGVIYWVDCDPEEADILKGPGEIIVTASESETPPLDGLNDWTWQDYYDAIDAAVPNSIEPNLLQVGVGPDWLDGLTLVNIIDACGDDFVFEPNSAHGIIVGTNNSDTKFVKKDNNRGRLRYLNMERQFDYGVSPQQAVDDANAISIAMACLTQMGLPAGEFTDDFTDSNYAYVSTLAAINVTNKGIPSEHFEVEKLITVNRWINNFPVFESMARVTVSNEGLIGRMMVHNWPQFSLLQGISQLEERNTIITRLTDRVFKSSKGNALDMVFANQGYLGAGEKYVPVIRLSFTSNEGMAGQVYEEPAVVMPFPDKDLDSVPDDIDNCPDTANHTQWDFDSDGVGYACDNCRWVYNPDQDDSDYDGLGDACDNDWNAEVDGNDDVYCGDLQHSVPLGDLNHDCKVNLPDIAIMLSNWLVDCMTDPLHLSCQ